METKKEKLKKIFVFKELRISGWRQTVLLRMVLR